LSMESTKVPTKINTRLESEKYLTSRKGLAGSETGLDPISGTVSGFLILGVTDTHVAKAKDVPESLL
jgi:hypothetical protein